jgi:hypothetical protein
MMTITRAMAVAAVLAGAAVGMAGPASAEPLSGPYTTTIIDGGGIKENGSTSIWTLASCGPDCTRLQTASGFAFDLHPQGNTWTGSFDEAGVTCTSTLDNSSLLLTRQCPGQPNVVIGLTKNG